MKKLLLYMIITVSLLANGENKKIQQSYAVEPGAEIIFETIAGMDIELVGWDKDEVNFDLVLDFDSSDKDYEKRFMEDFEIIELKKSGKHKFKFSKTQEEGGWNFFDLFKMKFSYYENISLTGSIHVPANSKFTGDFRYGDIDVSGLLNTLNIEGKGNNLEVFNCGKIERVTNDYGDVKINDCAGELSLSARSNNTDVRNFGGNVKLDCDYSNIKLFNISGNVKLKSRSGEIRIENVKGEAIVDADYSNINLYNIGKVPKVESRSANLLIDQCELNLVLASYMNIDIRNVTNPETQSLRIENRSGGIRLDRVTSDVKIIDQYSNISFMKVTGNINVSSVSGTITGQDIKGNLVSSTQYASLEFNNLAADTIDIENRSNHVELKLTKSPKNVRIDNQYGGVYLDIAANFGGKVKLYSTYGNIITNLPIEIIVQGASQNAVDIVEGGDSDIFIKTQSGNIELKTRNLSR